METGEGYHNGKRVKHEQGVPWTETEESKQEHETIDRGEPKCSGVLCAQGLSQITRLPKGPSLDRL